MAALNDRSREHPHLLPAIGAQRTCGAVNADAQQALALLDHLEGHARTDALRVQVLKEARFVLELVGDPFDGCALADRESIERSRWTRCRAGHRIAVRARLRVSEHSYEALLHLGRHSVL